MGQHANMVDGKKLAIIARMDDSGLGHQTRDLVRALKPDKVVAIDFTFYNKFKQHPEWYKDYDVMPITGFIGDSDVVQICKDVDIVLTAETFYNNHFISTANTMGVATFNQINYEFFEPLSNRSLLIPSRILMPSYWKLEEMKNMALPGKVEYLPPPTFVEDYNEVRKENFERTGKRRFLHVAGKMAAHDRAGTLDLIEAMKLSKGDFELVIKVQSGEKLQTDDPRITLDYSEIEDERELYRGFDAMVQPRRYAGLNLPMNEALASGLPVIMTNISPNSRVLPQAWLVSSTLKYGFHARTLVEVHSAMPLRLAEKLDQFASMDDEQLKTYKKQAHDICLSEYSPEVFLERWGLLMSKFGV